MVGSLHEALDCEDKEGMKNFYYTVQDLKVFVFSLIGMHFKIKPVPL